MAVLLIIVYSSALTLQITPALGQTIVGHNSISGRVYDANHNAIPNAKVTLYNTKFTLQYEASDPVKSPNNPQYTSNGSTSLTGLYVFTGLSSNVYIVTAEKDGIAYSETVLLKEGTMTADITIPGYVEKSYSSSPTITPRPSPTYTKVIPTASVPGPDVGTALGSLSRLALMALVGLQLVAGVAIIAFSTGQKNDQSLPAMELLLSVRMTFDGYYFMVSAINIC